MAAIDFDFFYHEFLEGKLDWTPRELRFMAVLLTVSAVILGILLAMRRIKPAQALAVLLLVLWLCLVFSYCVFTRPPWSRFNYELEPFWSWKKAMGGDRVRLVENILNVFLLMPVGLLAPAIRGKQIPWQLGLLGGLLLSLSVETTQYITHRGTFDVDDILYNCAGCVLGVIISNIWAGRNRKDRRQ